MEKPGGVDRGGRSSGYCGAVFVGGKKSAPICRVVQQFRLSGTGCCDRRFLRSGAGFSGGAVSLQPGDLADCFTDSL